MRSQETSAAHTITRKRHQISAYRARQSIWNAVRHAAGRTEEAYGEDVFLAGEMTAAYTKSMAADNGTYLKTIPTLKHLLCANNNELHRSSCNSVVPLRLKYEYYYAAFRNAIVNGGAKSIMTAYNEVNGIPALCNPEVQSILKDKWGLVVCSHRRRGFFADC